MKLVFWGIVLSVLTFVSGPVLGSDARIDLTSFLKQQVTTTVVHEPIVTTEIVADTKIATDEVSLSPPFLFPPCGEVKVKYRDEKGADHVAFGKRSTLEVDWNQVVEIDCILRTSIDENAWTRLQQQGSAPTSIDFCSGKKEVEFEMGYKTFLTWGTASVLGDSAVRVRCYIDFNLWTSQTWSRDSSGEWQKVRKPADRKRCVQEFQRFDLDTLEWVVKKSFVPCSS